MKIFVMFRRLWRMNAPRRRVVIELCGHTTIVC